MVAMREKIAEITARSQTGGGSFFAFGAGADSPWYRLSVGTCKKEEIGEVFEKLEKALAALK